jgi:hypothetical protein
LAKQGITRERVIRIRQARNDRLKKGDLREQPGCVIVKDMQWASSGISPADLHKAFLCNVNNKRPAGLFLRASYFL